MWNQGRLGLISMVTEPSEGFRSIMKTVRRKTLQEQKREYPWDKLMSSTETVTQQIVWNHRLI